MFKGVFILKKMTAFKRFVSTALICSFLTVNVPLVGTSGQKVDAMEDTTMTHVSDYSGSKADYFLQVDAGNQLFDLSNLMYGIFLEDINASCDGGLSAEMVENRSFEYGTRYGCKPDFKWNSVGDIKKNIRDGSKDNTALNKNNPHYMVLTNESGQMAGLENEGYLDGMAIRNDMKYQFSVYAKGLEGFSGDLQVDLMVEGKSVASEKISGITENWEKYELELAPSKTASSTNENKSVKLQVTMNQGSCALDMVSLMPQNNIGGFRADLVNNLKEMTPSFFRFPGGCVTEGTSTPDDAYNWKQSIGCDQDGEPLKFQGVYGDEAARRIGENNDWNYYMSYDLGFYEYFELCEYLNTLPIPVLNAGLGCDVRGAKGAHTGEELQKDIQTALDLVEFCRGDESTKWGAVRISMGHNLDENGDIIIKLVNVTDKERTFGVSVKNAVGVKDTGVAYCLAGNSLKDKNEIGASDNIETKEETVTGLKEQFNYTVPKYSITILRVPTDGTQDQPTDPTKSPLPVKSPVATKSPTPTATPTVSPTPTAPSVPTTSPVPNVVPDASPNPIEKQVSVIKKGNSFSQGDIQYQVTKTGKQASVSITGTRNYRK